MSKKIEPKCKNCRLFNEKEKRCSVVILHEGERFNLPVDKEDKCFFENEFVAINPEGQKETFKAEVQQIKCWVEDPKTGEKTSGEGTVKIEYPESLEMGTIDKTCPKA